MRAYGEPWDRTLWGVAAGLALISLIALRSASATLNPALAVQQACWVVLGMLLCLGVGSVSYLRWLEAAVIAHGVAVALLIVVMVAGTVKLGASRWIQIGALSMQPSELAKVTTVCVLAHYLSSQPTPLPLRSVLYSALLAGVPAGLTFLQPDLGTSTIFFAIWFGVVWAAGLSRRHLMGLVVLLLMVLPVGWHVLKDYQRTRLLVFLNPQIDPLGAGYTIIQSKIAIGSGQIFGRGWMAGTQNHLNFLPERHADFLFSVIGEEWGWWGTITTVALFGTLVWRMSDIAIRRAGPSGRLLAAGVISWIGYQAVVNMGMVMGLLPVVGVPLPLVSYGGSAMVMVWLSLGIVHSVHRFGTGL